MRARPAHSSNRPRPWAITGLLALAVATWWWSRGPGPETAPTSDELFPTNRASVANAATFEALAAGLKSAPDAAAARLLLAECSARLTARPVSAAVADIRRFLATRADASTRLGFRIGPGGVLEESPALRVFLLDQLARLDPAAAAIEARVILASKDSPDEWALALRNLARGDTGADARALLQQKTEELLRHAPWQENPSAGYLEAFDTAVFLGGTALLPALTDLLRSKDRPAVAHASFLALDRLVINDTAGALAALQSAPQWMEGREQTRANFFARADVRDPRQRQAVENYLASPGLGAAELEAFAGTFPNANFMLSANLLTAASTQDGATLAARDAESLRVTRAWLVDPRFAARRPALEKISRRLEEFARQSGQP